MDTKVKKREGYKIAGFSVPAFLIMAAIVITASYLNVLPKGMIGALAAMFVVGSVLNEVGNHTPIIKTYLGGGPIVIIFVSAAMVTYNIFPKTTSDIISDFMKDGSAFLDFYIAALITGSILGMKRDLLIKAAVRYLPAILGGVVVALGFVGITGAITGFGSKEAVLFIGIPIMGGGMGAGAVPLAKIFGTGLSKDPKTMLSMMVPAVALGNALAIVIAGLLDKLGKSKPNLTGNGELMVSKDEKVVEEEVRMAPNFKTMGIGLFLSLAFFVFGCIIGKLVPSIHAYAWMIITVAVVKILGILPEEYEEGAYQWFQFVMTNWTSILLVGIGVAYTDLAQVIAALTPQYLLLVGVTVIGAALGAGLVGKLVGFYPIESAITAGLCMANMGGTGDVAVLSASKRMKLMPFAQISSRIGGAFILILASSLIKLLI
jgi:CCS family citrate carrier protein